MLYAKFAEILDCLAEIVLENLLHGHEHRRWSHWSRPLWFTALVADSQREVILTALLARMEGHS